MSRIMTYACGLLLALPLSGAPASTEGAQDAARAAIGNRRQVPLFLTITNGPTNFLAVLNTKTFELNYVPTGGQGGAGGNAGSVAVQGTLAAAVNFGSSDVTIFARRGNSMQPVAMLKTTSKPVSVAFGHSHLAVLEQTMVESFTVFGEDVSQDADGTVGLLKGDKSAAQIVSFDGGFLNSEKSGGVALLKVVTDIVGAGLHGPNVSVMLPASPNNDTPFGMIGRGPNVYVTVAHSNLEALVVDGKIISTAGGPTPYQDQSGGFLHAPCWNALSGQFLYAADTPGKQLLRYLVSNTNVFFDKPAVATFGGGPTDLAADNNLLGVIDSGDGVYSNVSLFNVDPEGELVLRYTTKIVAPINGAAIIR